MAIDKSTIDNMYDMQGGMKNFTWANRKWLAAPK